MDGATLTGLGSTTGVQTAHGPERARDLRAAGERQDLCAQVMSLQVKMGDAGRDTKLHPVCAPWKGDKQTRAAAKREAAWGFAKEAYRLSLAWRGL